jgi:putative ABC transport system permease protein
MLQAINLSWSQTEPPGTKTVDGSWWSADETKSVVAVEQRVADRIGVHVGSRITFAAQDTRFVATVAAVTKADGQHAYSRAEFVLPPGALRGLPVIWYGGVHVDPTRVGEVQRALYRAYPTVTVINVAEALETVRTVVLQMIYVIQFLAAFSIFAGVVILASSIAGTRYRRIKEVVVLKTLGATRGRIVTVFSIEFAVLGAVAGLVGVMFANVIARVLLGRLTVPYHFQWGWSVGGVVATAALAVATGWMASHRILGQKPLEILREE